MSERHGPTYMAALLDCPEMMLCLVFLVSGSLSGWSILVATIGVECKLFVAAGTDDHILLVGVTCEAFLGLGGRIMLRLPGTSWRARLLRSGKGNCSIVELYVLYGYVGWNDTVCTTARENIIFANSIVDASRKAAHELIEASSVACHCG